MSIKNRLTKLEQQRGGSMPEVIPLYFDNGIVTKEPSGGKHPELLGKTEAEIDALYSGDELIIKIVKASQVKKT